MTATTDTRKRTREDDNCDSMPLSKRINNLHINNNFLNFTINPNGMLVQNGMQQDHHRIISDEQQRAAYNNGMGTVEMSETSQESFIGSIDGNHSQHNSQDYQNGQEILYDYSPELTQHENPYYYNKNKLLYELHVERLRRNPHQQ